MPAHRGGAPPWRGKGPLAVTPLFVQHNHRVAALIQVICLALLVFSLIERQVRQALGPEQVMVGSLTASLAKAHRI